MNDEKERIKKERRVWEKQAKSYDKMTKSVYEHAYRLSIKKAKEILEPHQQVLEIGCGTGIITFGIADSVENITAIDISPKMIEVAKEKNKKLNKNNIDFNAADGYELPYQDKEFDVILLFNVLHMIKEPERQLSEIYRLLKKDGYLITATDCYGEVVSLKEKLLLLLKKFLNKIGILPYLKNYKKDDLINLFENMDFQFIEDAILHQDPPNYYVVLKK
ncbi:MAG: class I SAM-dependent methyltransferase [Halanaerobiales bacterium]|nr:class I SAM-dependent methyltransferase [Halanaerobiales bacterium]